MFDLLNFSVDEETKAYSLEKKALIFVEGQHKDSMGRVHNFTPERVSKFVNNTNKFLDKGGRVPFQLDHKKTSEYNIGDVQSNLYTKEITQADLPDEKSKHLIGKVGVFVDKIVGKGKDVVQKIVDGSIKTLSAGLDPLTESFIEVSATPTPAIVGISLFSTNGEMIDNILEFTEYLGAPNINKEKTQKAFSYESLAKQKESLEERKDNFEDCAEDLYTILDSIYRATDEELATESINPVEASYEAISYFLSKLEEMFELVETKEEREEKDGFLTRGTTKFPIGKTPSDYNKGSKKIINFNKPTKKIFGYYKIK